MKFADVPGHADIKQRLRDMVDSDRVPHALLLEGPSGTGKFMLARAFAQYLHCTNRTPEGDSCGTCPACRQHREFNHIDTIYSFPVVKRKSGSPALSDDYAAEFREFISENPFMDFDGWLLKLDNINAQPRIYVDEGAHLLKRLGFMTRQASRRAVILWLPERMNEDTANKLLKLVEEPFEDTVFIMVSNNARLILPTIYSRTQRIIVPRYTEEEVAGILESHGIESLRARDLAAIAEGNVNAALKYTANTEERERNFNLFKDLMRKAYGRKVGELRQWSLDVAALGREPQMRFIDFCTRLVRESFVMHLAVPQLQTLTAEEHEFVQRFFPFINEKNVVDMVEMFDLARRDIGANANAKIVFFDIAVRTIMLLRRK